MFLCLKNMRSPNQLSHVSQPSQPSHVSQVSQPSQVSQVSQVSQQSQQSQLSPTILLIHGQFTIICVKSRSNRQLMQKY